VSSPSTAQHRFYAKLPKLRGLIFGWNIGWRPW